MSASLILKASPLQHEWHAFVSVPGNIWLSLPGLLCGVLLLLLLQRVHHYLALPAALLAMPVTFYVVVLCGGFELDDLAHQGWIGPLPTTDGSAASDAEGHFWDIWEQYGRPDKVHLQVVPSLLLSWLGMYAVCAFGSCLDVAAISLDMGKRLDFNHELKTVGVSNFLSGIFGGFTGSYIFSLTTFTYRSGTNSRVVGMVLCCAELALVLLPVNVAAYLPKFFFGAVLFFIALDLMLDWLVHSRHKVAPIEYGIVWATFATINLAPALSKNQYLIIGMVVGLAISTVQFALSVSIIYAGRVRKSGAVHHHNSRVIRGFHTRKLLSDAGVSQSIALFELYGYIFFGSVVQMVADIEANVRVADATAESPREAGSVEPTWSNPRTSDGRLDPEAGTPGPEQDAELDRGPATKYVVLDLKEVTGVDATAARSCFLSLLQLLRPHGIPLCLAHVTPQLEALLRAHDVIHDDSKACLCFETTSEAVEWCEAAVLSELPEDPVSPRLPSRPSLDDRAPLAAGLHHVLVQFAAGPQASEDIEWVEVVSRFFERQQVASKSTIFQKGSEPDSIFVLESGTVSLYTGSGSDGEGDGDNGRRRILRYANGGIFGELDFFLNQPRTYGAVAGGDCTVHVLSREAYGDLLQQEPAAAAAMQAALLKHLCLEINSVLMVKQ